MWVVKGPRCRSDILVLGESWAVSKIHKTKSLIGRDLRSGATKIEKMKQGFVISPNGDGGLLVGSKVDGVEQRPVGAEMKEFVACSDIISAGIKLIRDPSLKEKIIQNHKNNIRCFIFAKVSAVKNGFVPLEAIIVEIKDGKFLFEKDARFKSYVESYDMEYTIPIFTAVINGAGFHAGIIGQPWINTRDLLSKIKPNN